MQARRSRGDLRRGSVLVAALVLALVVSIGLAALVQWSQNERQAVHRHVTMGKARMTAESVAQYGAAQIKARLEQITYFPDDEFRPGHHPPDLPDAALLQGILGKKPKQAKAKAKDDKKDKGGGKTVGGLLDQLLGPGEETSDETSDPATESSGYFRYEITPENLVIGRFKPARWEKAIASNPLYDGDPLIDQRVRVREVRMVSAAKAVDTVRQATHLAYCEQYLQVRDSPVWGNMFFYNMDLEIAPGPRMEIHGPVHTNGNLYVQAGDSLRFHASVTAAGRLYHGRAPGGGSTSHGPVGFKKNGASPVFTGLQQNGRWLDSRAENWVGEASARWAGNLRTREHGINPAIPAGMAPYVPDDPSTAADERQNSVHAVIEPAVPSNSAGFPGNEIETQKFASQACLVIEVGTDNAVALYKYAPKTSGTFIRDTGYGPQPFIRQQLAVPAGLIVGGEAAEKFYDWRRAQWVNSLDVDIGQLKHLLESPGEASAFGRQGVTFDPATEWNGIVYVAHARPVRGGLRLVNGRRIPSRPTEANGHTAGFTIATNAPVYIQGHYNADGEIPSDGARIREPDSSAEPPAGIAADAVTILSAAWSDDSSRLALNQRQAQITEVSAALLSGLVPTNQGGNGAYSGGVENLPRFLEDWSGIQFGYRGSIVVLYESESATEPWGSGNVYRAPDRVWGFNALFETGVLPPGTPNSRTYRRVGFRDLTSVEYHTALAEINHP